MAPESPPTHARPQSRGARSGPPVRVTVAAADAELAADRLFAAGASAVSELAGADGTVDLIADPDAEAVPALEAHFGASSVRRVVDPDRGSTWQDHAEVLTVGDRLVVRPDWLPAAELDPGQVEVVVAAADAFGSGAHPTTRMCLELVDRLVREGDRVLDVGSGSGVLAVAAALLGAVEVRCIDVDPAAVEATRRSASLSGVAERIEADDVPLDAAPGRTAAFDLVLANLLIPVIEGLGATLVDSVAPGGHLVVSGVLAEQRDRAVLACAPFEVVDELRDGDWLALLLGRH